MPATGSKRKSAAAKKTAPAKANGSGRGRRIEPASKATFGVDDKRAQYARLVIFNYGLSEGMTGFKGKDVNTVGNAQLEAAGKRLIGGTLLRGSEGIEYISELSKAGATDENVAKRGLTNSYAQEVRPFLVRLELADSFGRRMGERKAPAEKPATKTTGAKSRSAKKTATRRPRKPKEEPAPVEEVTDESAETDEGTAEAA